ncbi:protein OSB1, mitochondrial [Elaeis guineensis]|uniref:protein OSB1, mitochondrial n=1 Tax=Elaeis guineensis var. tenera TaxID=51953 RepID=UPI003C6D5B44
MALPTLCYLDNLLLKPRLSISASQNPNPNATFVSLFSSPRRGKFSISPGFRGPSSLFPIRCSSSSNADYEHARVVHPRPQEIPWRKELANSVRLIGIIGAPIQIKHLSSGKVVAWTRLGVKKSASETSWINLTFWDELAHVAFQHVEKGHQVYVSGRLVSDVVERDDENQQVYYKVVVQQLNFIERSFPPVLLYEPVANSGVSGAKLGNYVSNSSASIEELWQAFFANPIDWWDNRKNKKSPKYPDFKHKDTGEALWIEAKYNPPWVKSQLAILDSRKDSLQADGTSSTISVMYDDDLGLAPF